jgi:integrase
MTTDKPKRAIRDTTKEQYIQLVKKYNNWSDLSPDDLFEKIEEEAKGRNLSTSFVKRAMSAFKYDYIENTKKPSKDVIKRYADIIALLRIETDKAEKSGTNKFKKINWDDIKDMYKDISDIKTRVLVALYTLIPPRRLLDYSDMICAKRIVKILGNHNAFVNTARKPYFLFQNYKTSHTFNIQQIPLPSSLTTVLREYIKEKDIKDGDSLLGMSSKQLSARLKSIFGTSCNGLRHSYITHLYSNNPKELLNIEETARLMAHSPTLHLRYLDREQF